MSNGLVKHPRFENPILGKENKVRADISKQRCTDAVWAHKLTYVDVKRTCRRCNRQFYFFAEEQKYWYEDLQIWMDAKCVFCPECRSKRNKLKRMQKQYELLQKIEYPTQDQIRRFRVIAKTLIKIGCMKDRRKIDKLGRRY